MEHHETQAGVLKILLLVFSFFSLLLSPAKGLSLDDYNCSFETSVKRVEQSAHPGPVWLDLWLSARHSVRAGLLEKAVSQYEILLEEKKDLAEARWELACLLVRLERFEQAASRMELLLEAYPDRLSYLNGLANVMLKKKYPQRALEIFRRVHEYDPENIPALISISRILISLGRDGESLPVLEQVHLSGSNISWVSRQLVRIYFEEQHYEQARPLAATLADSPAAELDDLLLAARIYDVLGLPDVSDHYWRKVLSISPGLTEAHERLAFIAQQDKRLPEALEHLLVLLQSRHDKRPLLLRLGTVCMDLDRKVEALDYFEHALDLNPVDKETLRKVIYLQAALGNHPGTLAALERYFEVEKTPEPVCLRRAAELYDAAGRFHDAIPLYRQLQALAPDDPEILATLARDLLAIGDNDGALLMWQRLASLSSEPAGIYLAMAELLERLNRQEELFKVLEQLHQLNSANEWVSLHLADIYFEQGRYGQGKALFKTVEQGGALDPELLGLRAGIFEKIGWPVHALDDYEKALHHFPGNKVFILNVIRLAGQLGMKSRVDKLSLEMKAQGRSLDWRDRLILANGSRDCGDDLSALQEYRNLLANESSLDAGSRLEILLAMAELYRQRALYFEEEQTLRQALLLRRDQYHVYEALVRCALAANEPDRAGEWFSRLQRCQASKSTSVRQTESILAMKLLYAQQEYRQAVRFGCRLLGSSALRISAPGHDSFRDQARLAIGLDIVRSEIALARYEEAEQDCRQLVLYYPEELQPLVLLMTIQLAQAQPDQVAESKSRLFALAGLDHGTMLALAHCLEEMALYDIMAEASAEAKKFLPDSWRASLLFCHALALSGQEDQALTGLDELRKQYPDNLRTEGLAAWIFYRTGDLVRGLQACEHILEQEPDRADMLLLKARIFWADQDLDQSIKVYRRFLETSLEERFIAASRKYGGEPIFSERKKGFWQAITFSRSSRPDKMAKIMAVSSVDDPAHDAVNEVAVPLYAAYRHEIQFSREMAARSSMRRREYFQAVKEYEALLRENPADRNLLFDLAGIYSRLGRLDDEAMIYRRLLNENSNYPGLQAAAERNQLKRQPRASMAYRYCNEEGRDGYVAMKQESSIASLSYAPALHHNFDFSATRIRYESTEGYGKLKASRAFLLYQSGVFDWLDFSAGAGLESLEGGYSDTVLFSLGLNGQVGDKLQGYLRYSRDVVSDTTASLSRNVVGEELAGGFSLDVFPRLISGADYSYMTLSDGNDITRYDFWASYIIWAEPTFLKFSYIYDFRDAREDKNQGLPLTADGFSRLDHPYWSPKNFWYNRFSLFFKHSLSGDTLGRGTPTFYTAEYGVDYDAAGHAVQRLKGSFFVELTDHILVESLVEFVSSDEIRKQEFFVSAIYRW